MHPTKSLLLFCASLFFNSATQVLVVAQSVSEVATLYAPQIVPCPSGLSLVREVNPSNVALNPTEQNYLQTRRESVLPGAFATYLKSVQTAAAAADIAIPSYLANILGNAYGSNSLPSVGMANSGGGYRALLLSFAALDVFDSRNTTSVKKGFGGLLQAMSIATSQSGSALGFTAWQQANFPPIDEFLFGPSPNATANCAGESASQWGGLNYEYDYFEPYTNTTAIEEYIELILEEIAVKYERGIPVNFQDFWARCLARHYLNGTTPCNILNDTASYHGANILLSELAYLCV